PCLPRTGGPFRRVLPGDSGHRRRRGAAGDTMNQKRRLNVGMIGAGFIGQLAHLMNLVEVEECRVVALAEFRPELRRRVAARYDIPRTYPTHQELLQD